MVVYSKRRYLLRASTPNGVTSLGMLFGLLMDNIGLGISSGVMGGIVLAVIVGKPDEDEDDDDQHAEKNS